jgi:hypothetical protein
MREIVINQKIDELVLVEQNKFTRNKANWSIKTESVFKKYRQVYDEFCWRILKLFLSDIEL